MGVAFCVLAGSLSAFRLMDIRTGREEAIVAGIGTLIWSSLFAVLGVVRSLTCPGEPPSRAVWVVFYGMFAAYTVFIAALVF